MPSKVWDEIIYLFPNINGFTTEVWEWMYNFILQFIRDILTSKHMPSKVWDEITNPFPNINGFNIEVWKWLNNFIPQFIRDGISNPLNLIHISSRAPGSKQLPDSILSGVYDAIWHRKTIFNPSPNPNRWEPVDIL